MFLKSQYPIVLALSFIFKKSLIANAQTSNLFQFALICNRLFQLIS